MLHRRRLGEGRRLRPGQAARYSERSTRRSRHPAWCAARPITCRPSKVAALPVDERGDIYSVGVVLFELLTTDQLPFLGDTPTDVVLRHIQEPVPDPRTIAPSRGIRPRWSTW